MAIVFGANGNAICTCCNKSWARNDPQAACRCVCVSSQSNGLPRSGPGTELKSLLKDWLGITATPTCSCNARARRMDEEEAREPGWCEAHLEEIVGWLREEATKRKLPFVDMAGRLLVRRAIKNAERAKASA